MRGATQVEEGAMGCNRAAMQMWGMVCVRHGRSVQEVWCKLSAREAQIGEGVQEMPHGWKGCVGSAMSAVCAQSGWEKMHRRDRGECTGGIHLPSNL